MLSIYKKIKKKRNLRRISAVWLFLLAVELFCPAFCGDSVYADEIDAPRSASVSIFSNESKNKSDDASISSYDQSGDDHGQTVCNDECLCHATAIPGIDVIAFKSTKVNGERIAFRYGEPLFNSLPPPFQPPKRS